MSSATWESRRGFLSGFVLLLTTLVLLVLALGVSDAQIRAVIWFLIGIFGFTATSLLADAREHDGDRRRRQGVTRRKTGAS